MIRHIGFGKITKYIRNTLVFLFIKVDVCEENFSFIF